VTPEPEVEYAVRLPWSELMPRPSLAVAQGSLEAIRARGGTAVLLSRTVERSEWVEVEAERVALATEFGVRPDQITLRGCGQHGEEWA
jgi:hypothetical protein